MKKWASYSVESPTLIKHQVSHEMRHDRQLVTNSVLHADTNE